jgi:DNA-binding MarR family transcriptional regulator
MPRRGLMKPILVLEALRKVAGSEENLHTGTALMFLYICAADEDETVGSLERKTGLSKSGTSRHILNLTERGDRARGRPGLNLVETYEDALDSRVKRIRLTPKGKKVANDITKIMEA